MVNISKKEVMIIQAGSTAVMGIVMETAKLCAAAASPGGNFSNNRAAGVRGGCTAMLPGILAMASLIGLKDGKPCDGHDVHLYANEVAITFIASLMGSMAGETVAKTDDVLLTVEFSPVILAQALEMTERKHGPADGKIDPHVLEAARQATASGNQALDMLNRLVESARPH